jgi:hypothetical protein
MVVIARGTLRAVPVLQGSTAAGLLSAVRVPAVRVPVVAIRASVTSEVWKLVRYFALLPVNVIAVPPLSDAVKLRRITNAIGIETDVVITPFTVTPTEIKSGMQRFEVLPQRKENKVEPAARVAAILPVVTPIV